MSNEYIKLESSENTYVKKNLLHAEMEILSLIKHEREYRKLRKEENTLKLHAKTLAKEITHILSEMKNFMPESKMSKSSQKAEKPIKIEQKKKRNLDAEIEEIKQKIARLR